TCRLRSRKCEVRSATLRNGLAFHCAIFAYPCGMSRSWCGWLIRLGSAALTVGHLVAVPALAEPVDVELVLAVDVSLSMSPGELAIQRDGYAAALTHERVLQAIAEGYHGKIAVTYFEWAGTTSHRILVPWTTVGTKEDAQKVATM